MAIDYEKNLFECCECGWTGKHDEKDVREDKDGTTDICPECGCEDFYLAIPEKEAAHD